MLLLDDQEDIVQQLAVGREVLVRATYDTFDDINWTRRTTTTCQTKQTTRRAGGGRYVVCGTTKNVSVKKWVHRLTDEKFSRATYDTSNDTEI